MPRSVPVSATQTAGNLITGALWNAGPAASNTFLTTVPTAEVYQTLTQTLTNNVWTAISQDSTFLDTDGQHSNSVNNSRFICQVPGYYSVGGAVGFSSSNINGSRGAAIYKNGSALGNASGAVTAASNTTHVAPAGSILVQLSIGDYVEIYGWQNSGVSIATVNGGQFNPYLYVKWEHA